MTTPLNEPHLKPISALDQLGIELSFPHSQRQPHLAIVFRADPKAPPRLCHLKDHHVLDGMCSTGTELWLQSPLSSASRKAIILLCDRVLSQLGTEHANVPYGYSVHLNCFDRATGKYKPQKAGVGLTCASFVLEIFKIAGAPLVNVKTWPKNRQEDDKWKVAMLAYLSTKATSEHVNALMADLGPWRVRCEEVASAATNAKASQSFDAVEALSVQILQQGQSYLATKRAVKALTSSAQALAGVISA